MLISEFINGSCNVKKFAITVAGLSPGDELSSFVEILMKETPEVFLERASELMKDKWKQPRTFTNAVNDLYKAMKKDVPMDTIGVEELLKGINEIKLESMIKNRKSKNGTVKATQQSLCKNDTVKTVKIIDGPCSDEEDDEEDVEEDDEEDDEEDVEEDVEEDEEDDVEEVDEDDVVVDVNSNESARAVIIRLISEKNRFHDQVISMKSDMDDMREKYEVKLRELRKTYKYKISVLERDMKLLAII